MRKFPLLPVIVLVTGGILLPGAIASLGAQTASWSYSPLTPAQVRELRATITSMKEAPRGPYLRIRWFCDDGAVLPPEPYACREHGGGRQHAEYTEDTLRFAQWGFHFGTILAATGYEELFDADNANYRLRELVLQHYLETVDDGWVLRRARYYRGARQIESEEDIGRQFLIRALSDQAWQRDNPLLTTMLVPLMPHGQPGLPSDRMRALALQISTLDPEFMDLRIKIHSTPGPEDLPAVRRFRDRLGPDASGEQIQKLEDLVADLESRYEQDLDPNRWSALAEGLEGTGLAARVAELPKRLADSSGREQLRVLSRLLRDLRELLNEATGIGHGADAGSLSLAVLDTVWALDAALFNATSSWSGPAPGVHASRRELLGVATELLDAAYGTGWLSARERESLQEAIETLLSSPRQEVTDARYYATMKYIASALDWAPAALHQVFGPVHERYAPVEPLVKRFADNALRGSSLLAFSRLMEQLVSDAARQAGMVHVILGDEIRSRVMALNPGVAVGPLHVISQRSELGELDPSGVYVLPETPADLGRVAGILTLGSGSRLSHVQLLARGLGIPNATIPSDLVGRLSEYEGRQVLYAVSPLGAVILRPAESLSSAELAQFQRARRQSEPELTIDTKRLDLAERRVLPLAAIGAEDSGRIVGPKAANLGQLYRYFPERVAPALVIPFGVFRAHVDRDLDGDGRTLHEEIVTLFETERAAREAGADPLAVRDEVLRSLQAVRSKILGMDLLPAFREQLLARLQESFGDPGSYGVFVRSDTNVEDLPGFSGAGLNLTVMNQIGTDAILRAIRDVWASPFSARSYMWRQRLITNPEAVYPSILLLRSVPSEASGVLVTTDIGGIGAWEAGVAKHDAWTVTVARGVGGVVSGEAAETILLPATEDAGWEPVLLSSARAIWENVLLRTGTGGIDRVPVPAMAQLLTEPRLADLRQVVAEIVRRYPTSYDARGKPLPWDIEFGFVDDHIWLFQIRPFVSSKAGQTLEAIEELDRRILAAGMDPIDLDAVAAQQ